MVQQAADALLARSEVAGLLQVRITEQVQERPVRAYAGRPAQVRQTLMAFLACGGSHTQAAEALHMHHNTVYKKVRRAEELLAMPIAERRVELTNALMLAQTLGAEVLPARD